jgi:hypothetical protein
MTAPSARRILGATVAALLIAAVLLVTVVLPAEYGIDPLGTGRLLGLTALAEGSGGAIQAQAGAYRRDAKEFILGPYEMMEYKYRLERGAPLIFSWQASTPVMYDFHSEPDGGPEGYAESFDKQNGASDRHGTYTAPFSGIHGWYWENPGRQTVTIRLTSAGFYTAAQEFRDGDSSLHELTDAQPASR